MATRSQVFLTALLLLSTAALGSPPVEKAAAGVGAIHGSTVDEAGRPVTAVLVELQPAGRQVASGADGTFELPDLAPGTYSLDARASGYTTGTVEAVTVTAGRTEEVTIVLSLPATSLDEIVVTARYSLLRDEPIASVDLDRQEIMALPHFGDDLYRAVSILPGTSAKDFSARFHVRGGFHDEVLVRLDGLELFEPFHLKDFEGVFSVFDPEVIGAVDLIPGSFPVEYGDRMSGVLDMSTTRPSSGRLNLGVSFSNLWAGAAGTFAGDRGRWLTSARRGYLDLLMSFVGGDQGKGDDDKWSPRYWDLFAKLDYDLTPRHSLAVKLLTADDSLTIKEREGAEVTDADTSYGNSTVGVSHLGILGSRVVMETTASASRLDRDRSVAWSEFDEFFALLDDRRLDLLGLRQEWSLEPSDGHFVKAGFEVRTSEADYDYFNRIRDDNFIDDPRFPPPSRTARYVGTMDDDQVSIWAADRMRLGRRLTAEIGGRYDRQELTDENQLSPRVNLVLELSRKSVLRAGWGHFYQSQRAHELDVEFGQTEPYPFQRAEHWSLGFERELPGGYRLRADAYRREVDDPHPRYETLFNTFNPIPEIEPDLIRIAADRVLATGAEVFVRGPGGRRLDWWASYSRSSIEDEIDGRRQARSIDQTHAVTANLNFRVGPKWNLNWVWLFHSGWPTTAVSGEVVRTPEGFRLLTYDIGPFYEERLPDYHRLDMRASRTTRVGRGSLTFFLDVQNLYDRNNLRGLEIDSWRLVRQEDGRLTARFAEEAWFGIMPSFGVSWER